MMHSNTWMYLNWFTYVYKSYISTYLYHTSLLMHRDGSSVMYPLDSRGAGRVFKHQILSPNDPVGIDLSPTPILAAKLRIFHTKQMTAGMALFMGITIIFFFSTPNQRSQFFGDCWNFPLKLGGPFPLVFPAAMTSLFGYFFNPVCSCFF